MRINDEYRHEEDFPSWTRHDIPHSPGLVPDQQPRMAGLLPELPLYDQGRFPSEEDVRRRFLHVDAFTGEAMRYRRAFTIKRTRATAKSRGCSCKFLSVWCTACLALGGFKPLRTKYQAFLPPTVFYPRAQNGGLRSPSQSPRDFFSRFLDR